MQTKDNSGSVSNVGGNCYSGSIQVLVPTSLRSRVAKRDTVIRLGSGIAYDPSNYAP